MAVIQIAALAALVVLIGYVTKESLLDVIPLAGCILVLELYALAFFQGLLWSDLMAGVFLLAFLLYAFSLWKKKDGKLLPYLKRELRSPALFVALLVLVLVPILTSSKLVSWWDEYNFWGTDVKSLYYLNGFATKYQNVASEFGDYPPGTQLLKWWFLHMSPNIWKEGLLFSGYYFFNLCFLVPLLKPLKKWNPLLLGLMAAALWLFPSCVEAFGYDGSCADLTMAVIYGAFLVAVVDKEGHQSLFYYGRQLLYLSVLMLCKNVAFLWVGFGILFMLGYHLFVLRTIGSKKIELVQKGRTWKRRLPIGLAILLPILIECSWLLFCLCNRRVAKNTGTAVKMATGNMNLPQLQGALLKSYGQAFLFYPLHRYRTPAIDLSPAAFVLLLLVIIVLLFRGNVISKRFRNYLLVFMGISGCSFYGINLVTHLTIFATETQYLEPFAMVSSIERYGAPFTIGSLYLSGYLLMNHRGGSMPEKWASKWQKKRPGNQWLVHNFGMLVCLLFVFLTADYESAYRGLIGYRAKNEEILQARETILDDQADRFMEETKELSKSGGRVLYLRDVSDISWVRNTYLAFLASPISMMYGNVDAETMTEEDLLRMMDETHAGYLYVDEIGKETSMFSVLTGDGVFTYSHLYRLENTDRGRVLVKE